MLVYHIIFLCPGPDLSPLTSIFSSCYFTNANPILLLAQVLNFVISRGRKFTMNVIEITIIFPMHPLNVGRSVQKLDTEVLTHSDHTYSDTVCLW